MIVPIELAGFRLRCNPWRCESTPFAYCPSANFHPLPPGPNNPVRVVRIALKKMGIGMHGTTGPDSIGRNTSHGRIRLANWDIVKLAAMVKRGSSVVVE